MEFNFIYESWAMSQGVFKVYAFFIIGTRQKCRAFIVDDKQVGLIRPDVFEYLQQYPAGKGVFIIYVHYLLELGHGKLHTPPSSRIQNAFIYSVYFGSKMNRQYLYIQSLGLTLKPSGNLSCIFQYYLYVTRYR